MAASPEAVPEPFPIFKFAHHYLLYDIDTVTYVRKSYNICGVLIGSLPQSPQQNVFLGLPAELMPEEARLLVEQGVAYVVNDNAAHRHAFVAGGLSAEEKRAYQASLRRQGLAAARDVERKKTEEKTAALQKKKKAVENWNDVPEDMLRPSAERRKKNTVEAPPDAAQHEPPSGQEESLFNVEADPSGQSSTDTIQQDRPEPYYITPTTSNPPLHASQPPYHISTPLRKLPEAPTSYPLFAHLHSKDYFLTPGLRFGCQYMAYPGDPLRFHSHFLCNGMEWDQEFDLLDLVGGGRLGTGVKKGFLIGGQEDGRQKGSVSGDGVRTFCVEWAGM